MLVFLVGSTCAVVKKSSVYIVENNPTKFLSKNFNGGFFPRFISWTNQEDIFSKLCFFLSSEGFSTMSPKNIPGKKSTALPSCSRTINMVSASAEPRPHSARKAKNSLAGELLSGSRHRYLGAPGRRADDSAIISFDDEDVVWVNDYPYLILRAR